MFETYDPEKIRCFPDGTRPDDWLTLPQFAAREGKKLLADWKMPADKAEWNAKSAALRKTLVEKTLGGFPKKTPLKLKKTQEESGGMRLTFEPEPGIELTALWEHPASKSPQTAILLNLDGAEAARDSELAKELRNGKISFVTIDLRATGKHAWPGDTIARAPDHNTAQWSLWIGRPLLGQWTYDVLRLIEALQEAKAIGEEGIVLACQGPAGVVGLCAAAIDPHQAIKEVGTSGMLASYISDVPYEGQRVGIMAPGILRDVGDIPHLAALALPARVSIQDGTTADNKPLSNEQLWEAFAAASQLAKISGSNTLIIGNAKQAAK
jgi:hypothetical protein